VYDCKLAANNYYKTMNKTTTGTPKSSCQLGGNSTRSVSYGSSSNRILMTMMIMVFSFPMHGFAFQQPLSVTSSSSSMKQRVAVQISSDRPFSRTSLAVSSAIAAAGGGEDVPLTSSSSPLSGGKQPVEQPKKEDVTPAQEKEASPVTTRSKKKTLKELRAEGGPLTFNTPIGALNPFAIYYGLMSIFLGIPWFFALKLCQLMYFITGNRFDRKVREG
jgi:hypothetical protein